MSLEFRTIAKHGATALLLALTAGAVHSADDSKRDVSAVPKGARSSIVWVNPQASIPVGDAITLIAQVDGAAPTGFVDFRNGDASIAGCAAVALAGPYPPRAQCTTNTLAAGFRTLTARYGGDSNNDPSASFEHVLFVNQRPVISEPVEVTMFEDDAILGVPVALSDPDSGLSPASLRVVSNNQGLLSDDSLVPYTWEGRQYFRLLPAAGLSGIALLTISIADVYGATTSREVPVTVLNVNDPPVIWTPRTRLHPAGSFGPTSPITVVVNTLGAGEPGQTATRALEIVNDPAGVVSSLVGSSGYVLSGNNGTARLRLSVTDDGGRENGGNDTASNEISVVVASGNNLNVDFKDWPRRDSPVEIDGDVFNDGPASVRDVTISVESEGPNPALAYWFCNFDECPPSVVSSLPFEFTVPVVPSGGLIRLTIFGPFSLSMNRLRVSARSPDPALVHPEDDTDEFHWPTPVGPDFQFISGFEPR